MNPPEPKNYTESPEIDLREVFRQISLSVRSLFHWLGDYGRLLVRNIWTFLAILLTAALIGFVLRYVVPRSYQSEAVFVSRHLPPSITGAMISNLNKYGRKSNNEALVAKLLTVDVETVRKINWIEFRPFGDGPLAFGKLDSALYAFTIAVRTTDTVVLQKLETAFVNYLSENDYSLEQRAIRKKQLNALQSVYAGKLGELDSLKRKMSAHFGQRGTGTTVVVGEGKDALDAYELEVRYYRERQRIEAELAREADVELLQPFYKPGAYNYPNVNLITLVAIGLGLLLALVFTPLLGKK